tara:strand:+ start:298 stop:402 length:105 start_codon:yes stop_codon:yes gene_type:complete
MRRREQLCQGQMVRRREQLGTDGEERASFERNGW